MLVMLIAMAFQGPAPPAPPPLHDPCLVFFGKGATEVVGDGDSVLANAAAAFTAPNALCVELIGHADFDEGSESEKLQLSESRVAAVERALVAKGMSSTVIAARGVGDQHPLTAKSHAYNQFVSIDFCSNKH